MRKVRSFIKELVEPLPVETGESRVALVDYNTEVKARLSFPGSSKSALSLALDTLKSIGGPNNIPAAIDFVKARLFSPSASRVGARRIFVLFMNGENPLDNIRLLDSKLKDLNNSGVDYAIVDVGREPANAQRVKQMVMKYGAYSMIDNAYDTPEAMPDVLAVIGIQKGMNLTVFIPI